MYRLLTTTVLLFSGCDCPDTAGATTGGCVAVPPSGESKAFEDGFFTALYGPYPIVPPASLCPTVDADNKECHDWWDGAGTGAKARAACG